MTPGGARPDYAEELSLRDVSWGGPELTVTWGVDDHPFTTALRYDTVDFGALEERYGREAVARLAFHVAMFEINKGVSFRPTRLTIAEPWAGFLTEELFTLWRTVVRKAWAQWRYEHDQPDYDGPAPATAPRRARPAPLVSRAVGSGRHLWFCGGGKDSLLASHLLDTVGQAYDALGYSHSVYGAPQPQFDLIDGLVGATAALRRHRISMLDTAMEPGAATPYSAVRYVLAAETPASLFATLPVALAHGHRSLVVAHERSANVGNLRWSATGEEVNHQWGKSLEAERLLGDYVRVHLAADVEYFSVLQPANDTLIFASLPAVAERIGLAHSCNVSKPWCMRCPKCAYVWLGYKAWLPWDPVDAVFAGINLLDLPENQTSYRQMLGLGRHTPFECIGAVGEVRLAFALAHARGLRGRATSHMHEAGPVDAGHLLGRYLHVAGEHRIPPDIAAGVIEFFEASAYRARRRAGRVLNGDRRTIG